jgi:hypothetical protein
VKSLAIGEAALYTLNAKKLPVYPSAQGIRERGFMTDWQKYFYNGFPDELRALHAARQTNSCPHHPIPRERALWVQGNERRPPRFWMCWYGLTLLDQALHCYFPEAYNRWVRATNGYPVPMQSAGFSCIRRARPNWLLQLFLAETDLPQFDSFARWFVNETTARLPTLAGIQASALFQKILMDNEFGEPSNPFENQLRRAILETLSETRV